MKQIKKKKLISQKIFYNVIIINIKNNKYV
jgi:hypothetical protein